MDADDSYADTFGNEYLYWEYVGSGPWRRTLALLHIIKITCGWGWGAAKLILLFTLNLTTFII